MEILVSNVEIIPDLIKIILMINVINKHVINIFLFIDSPTLT